MRRLILFIALIVLSVEGFSQLHSLRGTVIDDSKISIEYAPVVLLNPSDSTMAYYGVTNDDGIFEIRGIKAGRYLLQVSLMGHKTLFMDVAVPLTEGDDIGNLVLAPQPISLGEVVIAEEHIPMQFKHDTMEYNALAFNLKPDAVTEDLLKKLPGLDVDRAGNIKAMGEDIKKVLVDGKEFFGSDPKMATRNIPANALRKIQVYDKRSDESEFTGIDDGSRDKTLNLLLKEDSKNAVFGDLMGGAGTGNFYQASGKIYKFTDKNQFASLGMLNNINQFGFSFKDYIDFSGGLHSMASGGGKVQIKVSSGGGSSFPINFGQPVTGLSTSGAGGLNFSREYKKNSRIFMSYIANGSDRNLIQTSSSKNFTVADYFSEKDSLNENKLDLIQSLNFGLRDRIDSTQNIIINGNAALSYGKTGSFRSTSVFNSDPYNSRLLSERDDKATRISGKVNGSYTKLINKGNSVLKLASNASYSGDAGNFLWINSLYSYNPFIITDQSQFQDNNTGLTELGADISFTQRIGQILYIEPAFSAGLQMETLKRTQGFPEPQRESIDSLSPDFKSQYQWLRPGISLIRNNDKTQFTLALQLELGKRQNSLNSDDPQSNNHLFFKPELSWENEYKTGRRLRFYYQSNINVPLVNQLLPLTNISNPLALSSGNRFLKPEKVNDISFNWWIFDQFSFTSFLTGLNASYTTDKINWSRSIDNKLRQAMTLINVPYDYRLQSSSDFSTPIRKIGVKINTNIQESWNRGISYVNGIENINTNLSHRLSLSFENRKKTRWDVIIGGALEITDAKFSIQNSLNNRYMNISYFTEMQYNPNKKWNFQFTADVTNYNSESFSQAINIPLLGAEISHYFMKNNRGTMVLKGVDLLNRNTGVERMSDYNFLREQKSNMIGRFFMLSFRYSLNKFGQAPGGMDIKIRNR